MDAYQYITGLYNTAHTTFLTDSVINVIHTQLLQLGDQTKASGTVISYVS